MRITIEKGYQPLVQEVMARIRTEDPKIAVYHIIGCWAASGCQGMTAEQATSSSTVTESGLDEFDSIADWS